MQRGQDLLTAAPHFHDRLGVVIEDQQAALALPDFAQNPLELRGETLFSSPVNLKCMAPDIRGTEEREIAHTAGDKTAALVRRYIRDEELLRSNMTARLGL